MKRFFSLVILILCFQKNISMENSGQTIIPFANPAGIFKVKRLVENAQIKPQAIDNIPHKGLRRSCKAAAALYHAPGYGYNADQKLALISLFIDSVQARLVLPHVTELVEERDALKKDLAELKKINEEQRKVIEELQRPRSEDEEHANTKKRRLCE